MAVAQKWTRSLTTSLPASTPFYRARQPFLVSVRHRIQRLESEPPPGGRASVFFSSVFPPAIYAPALAPILPGNIDSPGMKTENRCLTHCETGRDLSRDDSFPRDGPAAWRHADTLDLEALPCIADMEIAPPRFKRAALFSTLLLSASVSCLFLWAVIRVSDESFRLYLAGRPLPALTMLCLDYRLLVLLLPVPWVAAAVWLIVRRDSSSFSITAFSSTLLIALVTAVVMVIVGLAFPWLPMKTGLTLQ